MLLNRSSDWGSVKTFCDYLDHLCSRTKAADTFNITSKVWGKLYRKSMKPVRGDGFAFYHATDAQFERPDPYGRRARISLIGELKDFRQEGQSVNRISVQIRRAEMEVLRNKPIIRDEKTRHLFLKCGMVPGPIATYFEVPPEVWARFRELPYGTVSGSYCSTHRRLDSLSGHWPFGWQRMI